MGNDVTFFVDNDGLTVLADFQRLEKRADGLQFDIQSEYTQELVVLADNGYSDRGTVGLAGKKNVEIRPV